ELAFYDLDPRGGDRSLTDATRCHDAAKRGRTYDDVERRPSMVGDEIRVGDAVNNDHVVATRAHDHKMVVLNDDDDVGRTRIVVSRHRDITNGRPARGGDMRLRSHSGAA